MSVQVTVKWNKEKFENVEINLGLPVRPTRFPEPIVLIDGREREGLRAKAHVDGLSRIRRWQCSRRSFFPLQACQRSGRKSWASKVRRHYIRRPFVDRAGSARAAETAARGLRGGVQKYKY